MVPRLSTCRIWLAVEDGGIGVPNVTLTRPKWPRPEERTEELVRRFQGLYNC